MSQNTPSDNTHLLIKFSENLFSFSSLEQNQSPTKSKWKCLEAVEKCGAQSSAHGWSHGWGTTGGSTINPALFENSKKWLLHKRSAMLSC